MFPGTNLYNRYTNIIIKILKSINLPLLPRKGWKTRLTLSKKGGGDFVSSGRNIGSKFIEKKLRVGCKTSAAKMGWSKS